MPNLTFHREFSNTCCLGPWLYVIFLPRSTACTPRFCISTVADVLCTAMVAGTSLVMGIRALQRNVAPIPPRSALSPVTKFDMDSPSPPYGL